MTTRFVQAGIIAGICYVAILGIRVANGGPIVCTQSGCSDWIGAQQTRGSVSARHRSGGGRPAGCPPRAWCGCFLARHLGLNNRDLWLARNWLRVGRPVSRPVPGAIAVYARGRRGGHVGKIISVIDDRTIELLSGNDGGAVRQRIRSTSGVIGYRILGGTYAEAR